jgi:hypothetical protein
MMRLWQAIACGAAGIAVVATLFCPPVRQRAIRAILGHTNPDLLDTRLPFLVFAFRPLAQEEPIAHAIAASMPDLCGLFATWPYTGAWETPATLCVSAGILAVIRQADSPTGRGAVMAGHPVGEITRLAMLALLCRGAPGVFPPLHDETPRLSDRAPRFASAPFFPLSLVKVRAALVARRKARMVSTWL